ncbi:MAG: bifunctional adenosylcobinamide kinase/adenosylcobinamide-phosphate guanylyltransferase [Lachnotalea sp.]
MVFVIGGAYQGKVDFVTDHLRMLDTDLIDGANCEIDLIYHAKGINHFHQFIRRLMKDDMDLKGIIDKLIQENRNCIIISTEIGCGLVPIDKFEREYREKVGRICCQIAKNAAQVYRVQCGIATKIYDEDAKEETV